MVWPPQSGSSTACLATLNPLESSSVLYSAGARLAGASGAPRDEPLASPCDVPLVNINAGPGDDKRRGGSGRRALVGGYKT